MGADGIMKTGVNELRATARGARNTTNKEQILNNIHYMLEDKYELEREIRVGEEAVRKHEILHQRLLNAMHEYLKSDYND